MLLFLHKSHELFGPGRQIHGDHFRHQSSGLLHLRRIGGDTDESIRSGVELLLQGDHHDVHGLLVLDVGGHLTDVGVVQGCVDLVQDKEWSWLITVDGEEKSQSCDGFLSSRQVGHGLESLARSNTVVVDSLENI